MTRYVISFSVLSTEGDKVCVHVLWLLHSYCVAASELLCPCTVAASQLLSIFPLYESPSVWSGHFKSRAVECLCAGQELPYLLQA
jgi:hypothetical protein